MPRITSRADLIQELLRRNPLLAGANLQQLPNCAITLDTPDTYNIANTGHVVDMLAQSLVRADVKMLCLARIGQNVISKCYFRGNCRRLPRPTSGL